MSNAGQRPGSKTGSPHNWWLKEYGKQGQDHAIENDSIAEVITTLQVIRTAVDTGELDKRIDAVMGQVKAGFAKDTAPTARTTLKLPAKA